MSLMSLLVILVVAGLVLWALSQFPLDATIMKIIRVVIVVVVALVCLQFLIALLGGGAGLNFRLQ